MTLEEVYTQYRDLRDTEVDLSESGKGRMMAYEQVCTDCIEINCMLSYRKASKQAVKKYLARTIDCYESSWPLGDPKSIAAHMVSVEAATLLRQVRTITAF